MLIPRHALKRQQRSGPGIKQGTDGFICRKIGLERRICGDSDRVTLAGKPDSQQ